MKTTYLSVAVLASMFLFTWGSSAAAAAAEEITNPSAIPSSGAPITSTAQLAKGTRLQVEWSGRWWLGEVLGLLADNRVQIHYVGWADSWDEIVPRSRLQLLKPVARTSRSPKNPIVESRRAPRQKKKDQDKDLDKFDRTIKNYERFIADIEKKDREAVESLKKRRADQVKRIAELAKQLEAAQDEMKKLEATVIDPQAQQHKLDVLRGQLEHVRQSRQQIIAQTKRVKKAAKTVTRTERLQSDFSKQIAELTQARQQAEKRKLEVKANAKLDDKLERALATKTEETRVQMKTLTAQIQELRKLLKDPDADRRVIKLEFDLEQATAEYQRLREMDKRIVVPIDRTQQKAYRAKQLAAKLKNLRLIQMDLAASLETNRQILQQQERILVRMDQNYEATQAAHSKIGIELTGVVLGWDRSIEELQQVQRDAESDAQKADRAASKAKRIADTQKHVDSLVQEQQRLVWFAKNLETKLASIEVHRVATAGNHIKLINDPVADGLVTEDGVTGYQYVYDVFTAPDGSTFVAAEFALGGTRGPLGKAGAFDGTKAAWYRESQRKGETSQKGVWQVWYASSVGNLAGSFGFGRRDSAINAPAAIWSDAKDAWNTNVIDAAGRFGKIGAPLPWAMANPYHTKSDYKQHVTDLQFPGDVPHWGDITIPETEGLVWGKAGGVFAPGQDEGLTATVRIVFPAQPDKMHWRIGAHAQGVIVGPTGAAVEQEQARAADPESNPPVITTGRFRIGLER